MPKWVGRLLPVRWRASKAEVEPSPLPVTPRLIRTLMDGHEWEGTVTDLAASLGQLGDFPHPPQQRSPSGFAAMSRRLVGLRSAGAILAHGRDPHYSPFAA